MFCDKILDNVRASQKDEPVVPTVESPLGLFENMYCRIGIDKSAYKVIGCLYHISTVSTICGRRILRLTALCINVLP